MSLNFKYIPLTFLKDLEQIKEQVKNTIILSYFFEKNKSSIKLEKLIEGTQYGYNASALEAGQNKFLRISDITDGVVNWKTVPFCDCKDEKKYLLKKDDLLIARTGGTTGKSFLIDNPPAKAIYAGYLIRIRANELNDPNFLNLFLNSYAYWSQVLSLNKGEFRPSVNASKLKELILPKCNKERQKDAVRISKGELVPGYEALVNRIKNTLNSFDNSQKVLSEYNTQKHLLTQLKQSILQDATQGKLTADWRSTKQLLSFEGEVPQAERFKITPPVPQAEKFKKTTQAQQPEDFKTDPQAQQAEQSKNAPTTLEDSSQNFSKQRGRINNLPHLKTFRKTLRNNLTPAEATLWKALKGKQLQGRRFRRQFSVANYILDFYCPAEKLAIELDGQGHFEATQAIYDQERDLFLNHCGINVLRFENKWVWNNMEAVLQEIQHNFDWENNPSVLRTAPLKEEQYIEPASELLKRIKAEKAQLIKEKKIKKEKPLPPITKDDIPFELPEGWVWCRLGETLLYSDSGKSPQCEKRPAKPNEWGVLTTTSIQKGYFKEKANKVLPANFEINLNQKVEREDILITRAGPLNRTGICCKVDSIKSNLILSDKTIRLKHVLDYINPDFIVTALNSKKVREFLIPKMTGMAESQVNISQSNIKAIPFPLPPLSEQKEIVKKVDALMQHCQALEQEIHTSETNAQMLMQAVLKEAFEGQTAHTDE